MIVAYAVLLLTRQFSKAIQGSEDYSQQFSQLIRQKLSPIDSYWQLVLKDIHSALDVFEPLHQQSKGLDGYVSVEVDPALAHDCVGTLKVHANSTTKFRAPM